MGRLRQAVLLYDSCFENTELFVFVLILVYRKGVGVEETSDSSGLNHFSLQRALRKLFIYSTRER